MNPLSIPPLIIASICIYVGLYHLVLFFRQKDDKINLTFAVLSIIVGIYDIFCFGLYNSQSLDEGIFWQKLQLLITNFIGISVIWFIYFWIKKISKNIFIFFSIFYIILFLLEIFIQNDLTLTANHPAIKHVLFFNNDITYYEATTGILFLFSMAAQVYNFVYMLYVLIKEYIRTRNKDISPIIVAIFIFFIATINDYMVTNKIYVFIYIAEYSYLILILSMTNLLLYKFVNLKESLIKQLYIDNLTNLPNRTKLMIDIEKKTCPFVLLINIDSFKEINDFFGNEIGDYVLLEMVNRLKNLSINYEYNIYKMHGDEYAILIDDHSQKTYNDKKNIENIIHTLFEKINDITFKFMKQEINIRVTIGVADYMSIDRINPKYTMKNKVINNADMVLKEAKKIKKSFLIYNKSMEINKEYENNIFWEDKLKKAIRDDRITLFYQPIISNKTNKIEKYECLIRMIDVDGNIISPQYFLEISKKARLYSQLTEIVLKKSFDVFYNTGYEFSINLSANDILNHETNNFIKNMLHANRNIAHRVVFEILESESVRNLNVMTEFIQDIKTMGCKLAIDDFGSGYSNFDYIIKLKVDYIKIDASIIKNLHTDRNSYIIAKMIVNAAKELGLLTIAEFVYSKEVYEKCIELGIDFSQGYYFGEPKGYIEKN